MRYCPLRKQEFVLLHSPVAMTTERDVTTWCTTLIMTVLTREDPVEGGTEHFINLPHHSGYHVMPWLLHKTQTVIWVAECVPCLVCIKTHFRHFPCCSRSRWTQRQVLQYETKAEICFMVAVDKDVLPEWLVCFIPFWRQKVEFKIDACVTLDICSNCDCIVCSHDFLK
jgi:hypothetical protein